MSNQALTTSRLATDISELLDAMILELELHGLEANHALIKRALIIQKELKTVKESEG